MAKREIQNGLKMKEATYGKGILKLIDKNDIFYRYDYNINFYGDLKRNSSRT